MNEEEAIKIRGEIRQGYKRALLASGVFKTISPDTGGPGYTRNLGRWADEMMAEDDLWLKEQKEKRGVKPLPLEPEIVREGDVR